ncbi:LOW QUALITY PROTEIN: sex hormone-binding globulin [Sarcophilus harrisii]
MEGLCSLTVLLLLLWPLETWGGLTPKSLLPAKICRDPAILHLGSGTGQEPVAITTFNFTKVLAISSELQTWDPEGVIFYGDTNPKHDWFMLGLRGGLEIQFHNFWAQFTVGVGSQLNDGYWHQVNVYLPQPDVDPWAFSLEFRFQFLRGSGCLLALGILGDQSLLYLDLQDQILVLSATLPKPSKSLPLNPGPLIQVELDLTRIALSQGSQEVALILPPALLVSHLNFWTQSEGSLLRVAPGEASSASFCLTGLQVQGRELDVDQALSRSKNIWTHSCQSLNNSTNTPH